LSAVDGAKHKKTNANRRRANCIPVSRESAWTACMRMILRAGCHPRAALRATGDSFRGLR